MEQHGNAVEQQGKAVEQQGKAVEQQGTVVEQQGTAVEQQGKAVEQHGKAMEQQGKVVSTSRPLSYRRSHRRPEPRAACPPAVLPSAATSSANEMKRKPTQSAW